MRSFCQDYKIWNDYCLEASDKRKRTNYSKMPSELSEAYAEFVFNTPLPRFHYNRYLSEQTQLSTQTG